MCVWLAEENTHAYEAGFRCCNLQLLLRFLLHYLLAVFYEHHKKAQLSSSSSSIVGRVGVSRWMRGRWCKEANSLPDKWIKKKIIIFSNVAFCGTWIYLNQANCEWLSCRMIGKAEVDVCGGEKFGFVETEKGGGEANVASDVPNRGCLQQFTFLVWQFNVWVRWSNCFCSKLDGQSAGS